MISKRQRTSGDIFLIFQGNYGNFHRSQKKRKNPIFLVDYFYKKTYYIFMISKIG